MLLAIDVGNTNTVLGVYAGEDLLACWRLETNEQRTSDEYAVLLRQLFEMRSLDLAQVSSAIVASVVPPTLRALEELSRDHLGVELLVVGPGMKTGMPILYENPREVGADRIVNSVAAFEKLGTGCIVVDFGTATTWDVVTPKGEYLGGIIAPGIHVSSEALYARASKLPRIDIRKPSSVVGRNTVTSMQSGLYYGYSGMVDVVVQKIREEIGFVAPCIATGGLATLLAENSSAIDQTDEMLTLRGLKILFGRN